MKTSTDGRFDFDDVPPGSYHLYIKAPGFEKLQKDMTISETEPEPMRVVLHLGPMPDMDTCGALLDLDYKPPSANGNGVVGTVRALGNVAPIRGARLTMQLRDGKGPKFHSNTDREGQFSFGSVTPGFYNIAIDRTGYLFQKLKDIEVPRENTVVIQTTMQTGIVICQ